MVSFLNTYAVSILAIAALTVLTAMGKLDANVAVPLITALAGVHAGSSLSNPTPVVPPVAAPSPAKPPPPPVLPLPPSAG